MWVYSITVDLPLAVVPSQRQGTNALLREGHTTPSTVQGHAEPTDICQETGQYGPCMGSVWEQQLI